MKILSTILTMNLFLIAQEDDTSPVLTYFTISPDTLDVINGSANATLTLGATDDLSGLSSGSIVLRSPSDSYIEVGNINFQGLLSEALSTEITIDQYAEPGYWYVSYISLYDQIGNSVTVETSTLDSMGFETELFVLSNVDDSPPSLTYFSIFPDTLDVIDGPGNITLTLGATDNLSGLSSGSIVMRSPSDSYFEVGSVNFQDLISDTSTAEITIDQYVEPGYWYISYISLYDQIGNSVTIQTSTLDSMGYETELFVLSNVDNSAPSLTYFSIFPDTLDIIDGPASVSIALGANDSLSGLSSGSIVMRSPSDSYFEVGSVNFQEHISDTSTAEIIIDQYAESGYWYISYISLYDEIGNSVTIQTSMLDSMGFETEIFVGAQCGSVWYPGSLEIIQDTSMNEDNNLIIEVLVTPEDIYNTHFEISSDTSSVETFVDNGAIYINPASNWSGIAELTILSYCAFDYNINESASFTLTVNPVDDPPFVDGHIFPRDYQEDFETDTVAYLPNVFVDIDGELTFSYSFTDSTIILADLSNDYLVLSSLDNVYGTTEIFVTASNPLRASVTDTVLVSVWPVNDMPFIDTIPDIEMNEDNVFSINLSEYISDIDSDQITSYIENISMPMNENLTAHIDEGDTLYLEGLNDWFGSGTITIVADDGELQSNSVPVNVTVAPVNDAPVIQTLSALVNVDEEFSVDIIGYDIDMDSLFIGFDENWTYPDWLSISNNPSQLTGTAPEVIDIEFPITLSDGQITVTDTFYLSSAYFNPVITSVLDVPNDQGGRVYLSFNSSYFDDAEETGQSYSFFRYDYFSDSSGWVSLGSIDCIGDQAYTFEATTIMDSMMTEYKVVASTSGGIFHSEPESGFSVDNIVPSIPSGLAVLNSTLSGLTIRWDLSPDEDFQYFILEKSLDSEFQEYEAIEIADTVYTDTNFELYETNYYRLLAVDVAGNISDYSEVLWVDVLSLTENLIPEVFALHQNYPNPFNPTTQINYDLTEEGLVTINIYDVLGRKIRTLINNNQSAGYRSTMWDGKNEYGEYVSAGMYIYMIKAGKYLDTKKMLLLK